MSSSLATTNRPELHRSSGSTVPASPSPRSALMCGAFPYPPRLVLMADVAPLPPSNQQPRQLTIGATKVSLI